jgi:AraC-like DNA-binding protein
MTQSRPAPDDVFSPQHDRLSKFQDSLRGKDVTYGYDAECCRPYLFTPHCHGDLELNLALSGPLVVRIGTQDVTLAPGQVACFWAAVPHYTERSDAEFVWVTIPLSDALAWNPPRLDQLLTGSVIVDERICRDDPDRFRRWLDELASTDPEWRHIARMEIQARLRRLLYGGQLNAAERMPPPVQAMLRCAIERSYAGIEAGEVAAASGLNPRWAGTAFKQQLGCTISAYLTRLRLGRAQRLLATTTRDVTAIALDAGFGSVPACYRAFAKHLGMPPASYRARVQQR